MPSVASLDVAEDTIALLMLEADICPFEHLISGPSKPLGAPSISFFLSMIQHIMSTLLSNLTAAMEVSDMVRLVN